MMLALFGVVTPFTCKPIECVFDIVKLRFSLIIYGFRLIHLDDYAYVATTCVILHTLSFIRSNVEKNEANWDT